MNFLRLLRKWMLSSMSCYRTIFNLALYKFNFFLVPSSNFKANFKPELVKDISFMERNLENGNPVQVLDARRSKDFHGVEKETTHTGAKSGHIPMSKSVPFYGSIDPEKKVMISVEKIKNFFEDCNVDLEAPIVVTCETGITSCILGLAIFMSTGRLVPNFDDSYIGWTQNTPEELHIRE